MKTTGIRSPARSEGAAVTPRRRRPHSGVVSPSALSDLSPRPRLRLSNIIDQFKQRNKINTMSPSDSRLSVLSDNTDISEPRRKSWWRNLGDTSRDMQVVFDDQEKMDVSSTVEELVDIEIFRQEKQASIHFSETSDNESIASIVLPQKRLFSEKQNAQQNKFSNYVTKQYTKELLQDQDVSKNNENDKTMEVTTLPKKLFNYARKKPNKLVFPFELLDVSSKTNMNKTKDTTAIEKEREPRNLFGNRAATTTKGRYLHADFFASESEDDISDVQNIVEEREPQNLIENEEGTKKDRPLHADLFASESEDDISSVQNIIEETENTETKKTIQEEREPHTQNVESTKTQVVPVRADFFGSESEDSISDKQNKIQENENIKETAVEEEREKINIINNIVPTNINDQSSHANFVASESEDDVADGQNLVQENEITKIKETTTIEEEMEQIHSFGNIAATKTNERSLHTDLFVSESKDNVSSGLDKIENVKNKETVAIEEKKEPRNSHVNVVATKIKERSMEADFIASEHIKNKETVAIEEAREPRNSHVNVAATKIKERSMEADFIASEHIKNKETVAIEEAREPRNSHVNVAATKIKERSMEAEFIASEHDDNMFDEQNIIEENDNTIIKETTIKEDEINIFENIIYKTNDFIEKESEGEVSDKYKINENEYTKTREPREPTNSVGNIVASVGQNVTEEHGNESIGSPEAVLHDETSKNFTSELPENSRNASLRKSETVLRHVDEILSIQEPMPNRIDNDNENSQENFSSDNESIASIVLPERRLFNDKQKIQQNKYSNYIEKQDTIELLQDPQIENHKTAEVTSVPKNLFNYVRKKQKLIFPSELLDISDKTTDKNEETINEEEGRERRDLFGNRKSIKRKSISTDFIASRSEDDMADGQNTTKGNDNTKSRKTMHDSILDSPEAILHDKTNKNFISELSENRRNTSIRKSKTIVRRMSEMVPIQEPFLNSNGRLSEGTKNSTAEGSGWDSHRTTRKTMRQTFGKDFTPRKSLRTLVMEKAAKRKTAVNDQIEWEAPNANSTQMTPLANSPLTMAREESPAATKVQTSLEDYLIRVQQKNLAMDQRAEEKVKKYITARAKTVTNSEDLYQRKPASRPLNVTKKVNAKTRLRKNFDILGPIPEEVLNDFNYKPPKRYQPPNASWVTKRLYSFLEFKLEHKYDYKARIRAEKLVESLYKFSVAIKKEDTAPSQLLAELQREMARLNIVDTYFEFYNFFRDFMPKEIRMKVIPDIANKLPLPPGGVFVDIIPE